MGTPTPRERYYEALRLRALAAVDSTAPAASVTRLVESHRKATKLLESLERDLAHNLQEAGTRPGGTRRFAARLLLGAALRDGACTERDGWEAWRAWWRVIAFVEDEATRTEIDRIVDSIARTRQRLDSPASIAELSSIADPDDGRPRRRVDRPIAGDSSLASIVAKRRRRRRELEEECIRFGLESGLPLIPGRLAERVDRIRAPAAIESVTAQDLLEMCGSADLYLPLLVDGPEAPEDSEVAVRHDARSPSGLLGTARGYEVILGIEGDRPDGRPRAVGRAVLHPPSAKRRHVSVPANEVEATIVGGQWSAVMRHGETEALFDYVNEHQSLRCLSRWSAYRILRPISAAEANAPSELGASVRRMHLTAAAAEFAFARASSTTSSRSSLYLLDYSEAKPLPKVRRGQSLPVEKAFIETHRLAIERAFSSLNFVEGSLSMPQRE